MSRNAPIGLARYVAWHPIVVSIPNLDPVAVQSVASLMLKNKPTMHLHQLRAISTFPTDPLITGQYVIFPYIKETQEARKPEWTFIFQIGNFPQSS